MKTKITKIGVADNPVVKTSCESEYVCGEIQKGEISPFVGYNVVGVLLYPIEVGKSILMFRHERNGVPVTGVFESSVVRSIKDHGKTVITDNSIYTVEQV